MSPAPRPVSAPPAAPGGGPDRRRQRTRAALLDAAIELFQRRGLRATKLEEICEAAGVSPRTFFNHFETREHLYRAIARQRAEQLAQLLDATTADPRPFAERFTALLGEMGAYLSHRPAYRELVAEMLSLRPDPEAEASRRSPLARALRGLVESAVARGELARRHPPAVLADVVLGALTTALANWCADEDFELDEELGRTAGVLLELLGSGESP